MEKEAEPTSCHPRHSDSTPVTERQSVCLTHSDNTKASEFGAEQGLLQGRWVAHALKGLQLLESFQQSPFMGKVRGGAWVVVADFLVSDPLFLRLGHGQVL